MTNLIAKFIGVGSTDQLTIFIHIMNEVDHIRPVSLDKSVYEMVNMHDKII